jgi:hypothetical protein
MGAHGQSAHESGANIPVAEEKLTPFCLSTSNNTNQFNLIRALSGFEFWSSS